MHTRIAEARDLHRLTEITTSSLVDDPVFDYMWAYREEFSEDHFTWWQLKLQKWVYDPRMLFLVTVLDEADKPMCSDRATRSRECQDTIISYAVWERCSRSRINPSNWRRRKLTQPKTLEQRLNNKIDIACTILQQWSLDRAGHRRDANLKHVQAFFDAQDAVTEELWSDVDELWNLTILVTDRSYRRRGAATKLVEVGTQLADQEGVYCRVEASPMGKLLYESCDFKELGVRTVKVPGESATASIWCMRRSPSLQTVQSYSNANSQSFDP